MKQLSALKLQYFFNKNGEGLLGVLRQVYPTYQWLPWMFAKVPSSVPKSENDIKLAINFVEQKLHISDPEGWFGIASNCRKFSPSIKPSL